MKNFLDIDEQIELNNKVLDFYHSSYKKTQIKISILVLIYSVIAIYIVQIIKYPFDVFPESNWVLICIYSILLLIFLVTLSLSIRKIYSFLTLRNVAYLHCPKYYYTKIKSDYEKLLGTNDEKTLNDHVKTTYLNELEEVVKNNSCLFKIRSKHYANAFKSALFAVPIYLLCVGFVIFKDERPKDFNLKNYKEIANAIDSLKNNK